MRPALLICTFLSAFAMAADYDNSPTVGPTKGWLIIDGGGALTNEVRERFVALAGGSDASFVAIPTALENDVDFEKYRALMQRVLKVRQVTVLHTRDRVRANSAGFVEPLRHASGLWLDGGRQYRLADAYLDTATLREIKALVARGGVVCGGSAGATIQGSFLVRGAPSNDNTIMISPGHTTGFGLLPNSAIDQHVNRRGREKDLDEVLSIHPELLGIGIDQDAAIIVHGDSFFVVSGQVAIHDGKQHDGAPYFFLSSGDSYNMRTRTADPKVQSPMTLTLTSASRSLSQSGVMTTGTGTIENLDGKTEPQHIRYECDVSLYSVGNNVYPAWTLGPQQIKILAREVNTDILREHVCRFRM